MWLVRGAFRCNQSPIIPLRAQSLGEIGRVPASTLTLSRHAFLSPSRSQACKKKKEILKLSHTIQSAATHWYPLSTPTHALYTYPHTQSSRSGFFFFRLISTSVLVVQELSQNNMHHMTHTIIHSFFFITFFCKFCPKVLHSSFSSSSHVISSGSVCFLKIFFV